MTSTKRLRLLADYLAATRNEIAVDEMLLGMAHVTPVQVGYLPRVPHWLRIAERTPSLSRIASRLGRILWLSGGALAYFTMELLRFDRLRIDQLRTPTKNASLTEGAILGFSSRVSDVIDYERFSWLPTVWLTCPWTRQQALPNDAVELPLLSVITRKDLRFAFACALRATYALAKDPASTCWALQGYTAFRWFLVRCVVDRITGTLVTTEHFDRWAVLVDRSVRADRQRLGVSRRLVVVQHGALGGLGGSNGGCDAIKQMPTRLFCVDELHTYNVNEENIFRRTVLTDTTCRSSPLRVRYFSPTITLIGEYSMNHPRLLFVGHPLCEVFQKEIYKALRESITIEAFYKPHPTAPMSASIAKVGWIIIEDPKMFPRVELLVSYPSTLVIEYEGAGVSASVHPLDISVDALPQFLEQTLQKIKTYCGRVSCEK